MTGGSMFVSVSRCDRVHENMPDGLGCFPCHSRERNGNNSRRVKKKKKKQSLGTGFAAPRQSNLEFGIFE